MNQHTLVKEQGMNRASRRSRRKIVEALLEILEVSSLSEISIREIADRADIVRRTFYSHFTSKEEVLRAHFESLCSQLSQDILGSEDVTLGNLTRDFFSFWKDQVEFLRTLNQNRLAVPSEILEDLVGSIDMVLPMDRMKSTYANAFLAGGLAHMLGKWVDQDCRENPETMAKEMMTIMGY
jgi:AcrR family transcriptional regulator